MWNDDNHTMWHNIIKGYNMKHMTHQMWYSLTVYGPSIDTLRKLWWWKQELSHLGPCDSGEAKGCSKIQQITPLNSLALKVYHSPMMPVNKMNLWDETLYETWTHFQGLAFSRRGSAQVSMTFDDIWLGFDSWVARNWWRAASAPVRGRPWLVPT